METRPFLLHALSPLHAGTGQSAGVIDLPIARMRATGIPFVPGSSIKGVLRDATRPGRARAPLPQAADLDAHYAVFGPARTTPGPAGDTPPAPATGEENAQGAEQRSVDHAGALVISDARLVALPVRSFRGTFAMVTSPLLLELLRRDLQGHVPLPRMPSVGSAEALVAKSCVCMCDERKPRKMYLEDLDLNVKIQDGDVEPWADVITRALPADDQPLVRARFAIVDDETMTFLWETATQVDTRVRIDPERHVVADGGLWTEESLPPETLLAGLVSATRSMRKRGPELAPEQIIDQVLPEGGAVLQLGGKATIGKGRCRMLRWPTSHAGEGTR